MKRTLLFSFLFLFLLVNAPYAEVLCSLSKPDTSGSLQLTSLTVSGTSNLKKGDSVSVSFVLTNANPQHPTLYFTKDKGTFVGAFAPSGKRDFGYSNQGAGLPYGKAVQFTGVVALDEAGVWKLWPAFCYSIMGSPQVCSNDQWHSCQLSVAPLVTDSDGDGVPDSSDQCPQQRETLNNYQDSDGCPDSVPDSSGPEISISVYPEKPKKNESFRIMVGAIDQSGIKNIVILLEGVEVKKCAYSPCEFIDISPSNNPAVGVSATDFAGNARTSGRIPGFGEYASGCYDSDGGDETFVPGSTTNGTTRIENGTIYLPETFYDTCLNDTQLIEYYCHNGEVHNRTRYCGYCYRAPQMAVEGGSVRVMGDSCLCSDSDDGRNYYRFGISTKFGGYLANDTCYGGHRLQEHYCDEEGIPQDEFYDCESRCRDGACLCDDSDGGINYEERGTALEDYMDYCITTGPKGQLLEYYSDVARFPNGTFGCFLRNTTYTCPSACGEGRCVPTCNDSVRNQGEEGIDCGGPCAPCNTLCLTSTKFAPDDTPCTTNWPDDEFSIVSWMEGKRDYMCTSNEVCHPELDYIVEEASACCSPLAPGVDNALCRLARSESIMGGADLQAKKCRGIYIIRGLGRNALWMKDYFYPETCCSRWRLCPNRTYFGQCEDGTDIWNSNVEGLVCRSTSSETTQLLGWGSDTDMNQNTCKVWLRPAHASINIIQTGICRDYSLAVNTLLRKAGYSKDEVIGFCDGGHCYNLVKFPGSTKFTIVDTTGNSADYDPAGGPPGGHPYCSHFNRKNWCLENEDLTYLGQPCTGSERHQVEGTPRVCGNVTYGDVPNYLCGSNDWGLIPIPEITSISSCNATS